MFNKDEDGHDMLGGGDARLDVTPAETWTIEKGKSFAYRFVDAQGRERGRYKDADAMATHFVFALQRIERMEKGAGVSLRSGGELRAVETKGSELSAKGDVKS